MPGPFPVRVDEAEGRALLEEYVFGGIYGPARVPRGIDATLVDRFVAERVLPASSPSAYAKALEVARFYERPDAGRYLYRQAFALDADGEAAVRRMAFGLQAAGDFDSPDGVDQAVTRFNEELLPREEVRQYFGLLLETSVALTPALDDARLVALIDGDVESARATELQDETSMMNYDRVLAIQSNELPRARARAALKRSVLTMPLQERLDVLVAIYLGLRAAGSYLEHWAGRALRRGAASDVGAQVLARFADAIEEPSYDALGVERANQIRARAAQAVLHCGGALSPRQEQRYHQVRAYALANFLSDDL
jgi:hypothetical protein